MLIYQLFLKRAGLKNPHFFRVVFNANQPSDHCRLIPPIGSIEIGHFWQR
jgi:hypothetical protein